MNLLSFFTWLTARDITVPGLSPQESGALLLLAASLLVFRAFRERYLLIWTLGWLAYFVSRWTLADHAAGPVPRYLIAISQAEFVLAVCLFAAAIFVYTHARGLLLPLMLITSDGHGLCRGPHSGSGRNRFPCAWPWKSPTGSSPSPPPIRLIRYRWARWEIGPWLLSVSMLLLHLHWAPIDSHLPVGFNLMVSLLAGLSMLLLVFDDYKLHMRRLGVVNALTSSITRAQQHGPIMATALEELKGLMRAKAAWFRLVEGDRMVIAQQIGLSKGFLQDRLSVPLDDGFERTLGGTVPVVLVTSAAAETVRPYLKQEGFHHVVMVPVLGKKSVIGTLALGGAHRLHYSPDEMEFLVTTAHQLGLAVENLRLVEQILRSHRQWTNTFDSIHDLVLLHDSDFRVMKANHALLERLNQAPADVVGQLCEDVLPHDRGQWQGCPYCGHPEEGFSRRPGSRLWRLLHGLHVFVRGAGKQAERHHSRGARHHRPAHRGRKIPACCLSRCRKAFSLRLRKANCSIAMTPSFACWATAAAKKCWP